MVIRTFFDRDNTIILNSQVNMGRNPITEIFYGGTPNKHSRYIFHFDETNLVNEYECGKLGDLSNLTHTLKMTATAGLNENLLGTQNCAGKQRTSSFNLVLFKINEEWDEGHGYDATGTYDSDNTLFSNSASNWIYSKTNTPWSLEGIIDNTYTGATSAYTNPIVINTALTHFINYQPFDLGNEDIEIDITDVVNDIILSGNNNGFGLAFSGNVETLETIVPKFVSFFTRDTNTFFEPFIETKTIKPLKDKRNNFTLGTTQQICIYPSIDGEAICLDSLPSVSIKDENDIEILNIPSSGVTKVSSGAYCVDVNISGSTALTDCVTYTDTWSGLTYNGVVSEPVINEFFVNPEKTISFGTSSSKAKDFIISVIGIKREEKIINGEVRKVIVNAKIPFTSNQQQSVENLEYRLYVREGNSQYTVIDFHPIEMSPELNFFYLDTNTLLPNTYYLDVRIKSNGQIKHLKEVLKFDIINEVNYKNIYS